MQNIIKYTIALLLSFYVCNVSAQEVEDSEKLELNVEELKQKIVSGEKEALKVEVEAINERVRKKEITYEEGENLKQQVAKKRALNIENRVTVLITRIDFNKRNNLPIELAKKTFEISFSNNEANLIGITVSTPKKTKAVKYDFRTTSGLVVALGFNNAILNGSNLGNSPYKLGGSGSFELGFQWKTRVFKNTNIARFRYGFSLQWDKYDIKNNKYFVQNGNQTTLETFPTDLKQAKFRTTSFLVPLYFELGNHSKEEKKDRIRFRYHGFKVGFGGYAGVNLDARQKLWYKEDGVRIKQKIKRDYNVNPFVYGVGAYIGLGDLSLYGKYNLSRTFKSNSIKQNNISVGLRWDIE